MIDSYRCILDNEQRFRASSDEFIDAIGEHFNDELDMKNVTVRLYASKIIVNPHRTKLTYDDIIKIFDYFKDFDISLETMNEHILIHLSMD